MEVDWLRKGELVLGNCIPRPEIPTRDSLTDAQFEAMLEEGYRQVKNGQTVPLDEAFRRIREDDTQRGVSSHGA